MGLPIAVLKPSFSLALGSDRQPIMLSNKGLNTALIAWGSREREGGELDDEGIMT